MDNCYKRIISGWVLNVNRNLLINNKLIMINSIEPRTAIKIITTGNYSEVKVISCINDGFKDDFDW